LENTSGRIRGILVEFLVKQLLILKIVLVIFEFVEFFEFEFFEFLQLVQLPEFIKFIQFEFVSVQQLKFEFIQIHIRRIHVYSRGIRDKG